MLYHLFDWLANDYNFLNVFRYLTMRAILGVLTALTICFLIGPAIIRKLVTRNSARPYAMMDRRRISPRPAHRPWAVC